MSPISNRSRRASRATLSSSPRLMSAAASAAREIEEAVIKILADALTSPASLVERFGAAGMASDQVRKLLSRAARVKAALGGSPGERAKLVHKLVEKIIVDEKTISIKLRRGLLLGEDVASSASQAASDSAPGAEYLQPSFSRVKKLAR